MNAAGFAHRDRRRVFLRAALGGAVGVLGSAWAAYARAGSTTAAYTDELASIEAQTRGGVKVGDVIDARNVDTVQALLDPVRLHQIRALGRRLRIGPTTTDLSRLLPPPYVEATLRHRGQARFDAKGNVVTATGAPWIGGNPFPEPQTAQEVFAAHTLSWGRHDASVYVCRETDLDAAGKVLYEYTSCWAEMATTGRLVMAPRPTVPEFADKLRLQSVLFLAPDDVRGTAYLNVWPYDQTRFPTLYGYLPAFRRVRELPTNQRFEALNPGSELYLSDAWAAGDPYLTWGNYRIVGRGPFLGAVSSGYSTHANWLHSTHGGPNNNLFWDTTVELVPDAIVVEVEPIGYPRAPVSRKRVWFDARTLLPLAMASFDRRGQLFRFFDGAYARYEDDTSAVMAGSHPYWSWTTFHAFNVQTGHLTRVEQIRQAGAGHTMRVNDPGIHERYLTLAALQRGA